MRYLSSCKGVAGEQGEQGEDVSNHHLLLVYDLNFEFHFSFCNKSECTKKMTNIIFWFIYS